VRHRLDPGITWFGWHLPVAAEAAMVVVLGVAMLAAAIVRFARTE
jgi:ABC-2 type transport system permease protein